MTELNDRPQVRIHPPVLTLIYVAAAFLLNWLIPFRGVIPQPVTWLGILLVLIGLAFALLAVNQFRTARTTLDPHGSVSAIVMQGPYRFSRNPIYLGFVCMLIGLPLAFGSYWGAVLSPVFVLLMNTLVIQHEEFYLEKKFGETYADYKSRVRRWL